jgi:hypothetical protein
MITQSDKPELAFVVFDKKGEKEPFQVTSDSELMIVHTASGINISFKVEQKKAFKDFLYHICVLYFISFIIIQITTHLMVYLTHTQFVFCFMSLQKRNKITNFLNLLVEIAQFKYF